MVRLRFEKASQVFDTKDTIILPIKEIINNPGIIKTHSLIGEIAPMCFEGDIDIAKEELAKAKELGITDVISENIGAISMAKEAGFNIHGGFTLNILNSAALAEYKKLGLIDSIMSIELSFANVKKLRPCMPIGMITYGYMPMMKLRSCPARGEKGCGNCDTKPVMTDRMGKKFRILCKDRKYSELLNFVPLYVADKPMPKLDFELLYYTVETKEECEKIYKLYSEKKEPGFERTAGLYFRELL